MNMKIVFNESLFEDLKASLEWDGREKIVYLLCNCTQYKNSIKLLPYKLIVPEEKDYISRSAGHIKIDRKFITSVFKKAVEECADVIWVHIHPEGAGGEFSLVDKHHEPILMRHIAEQVKGVYNASMVFSNDCSELDSWFYDRENDELVPVEKIIVVGKNDLKVFIPTGSQSQAGNRVENLRYDRTIKAFGKQAVEMLSYLDVGIVGASALGGPSSEMVARDGFKSTAFCDPDIIDETNLNRLIGTCPDDIGRSKVEFYAEYAKKINPDVKVSCFKKSFYDDEVQQAFAQVDILLGCVDSEVRLSINSLAMANRIPYFDMGAAIVRKDGKVQFKGGQVYSIIPGRNVCLECSGVFNNLKSRFWSEAKKEKERSMGYLKDEEDNDSHPLVSHLDYVIAGFGYHEMLSYIWGQGTEHFKVYIDMVKSKTSVAGIETGGCMYCRDLLGQGDKVSAYVPQKDEELNVPNNLFEKQPTDQPVAAVIEEEQSEEPVESEV